MRRPNDVGGLPAGPIGPRGHEPEPWEFLLTALVSTVGPRKRTSTESIRRAREDLEPGFYNSLTYLVVGSFESKEPTTTYFELWTQGFINLMEEKGVLTRTESRCAPPRSGTG